MIKYEQFNKIKYNNFINTLENIYKILYIYYY